MTQTDIVARWTFRRLFLLSWAVLLGAVTIKIILYAIIAVTFDLPGTPIDKVAMIVIPGTGIAAWLLARWVRGLIEAEDKRPRF